MQHCHYIFLFCLDEDLDISISKFLMFRLPTLASILDAKAEEEQSEKCEVEHEHIFAKSPSCSFEPKL